MPAQPIDFGQLLASREMVWKDDAGNPHSAFVDIGVPQVESPTAGDEGAGWFCTVRLRNFGDDRVRYASGEDAVQAMHLVLVLAGALVTSRLKGKRSEWAGLPNYGFPSADQLNQGSDTV